MVSTQVIHGLLIVYKMLSLLVLQSAMATDSAMDTGERVYGGCVGPDAM